MELIQAKFQENIECHYRESGLADKVQALAVMEKINPSGIPLDDQALNLVTEESQGLHGWVDMLPNLRNAAQQAGLIVRWEAPSCISRLRIWDLTT